jgi:hypothetical protein
MEIFIAEFEVLSAVTIKSTVTDLIIALPGNSYVNTVQHATIDVAVFSMSSALSNSRNGVLCDQLIGYATVLTTELFSVWSVPWLHNEIPRITGRVTELVKSSYESVVRWRSEYRTMFSPEVPE